MGLPPPDSPVASLIDENEPHVIVLGLRRFGQELQKAHPIHHHSHAKNLAVECMLQASKTSRLAQKDLKQYVNNQKEGIYRLPPAAVSLVDRFLFLCAQLLLQVGMQPLQTLLAVREMDSQLLGGLCL